MKRPREPLHKWSTAQRIRGRIKMPNYERHSKLSDASACAVDKASTERLYHARILRSWLAYQVSQVEKFIVSEQDRLLGLRPEGLKW